MREKFAGRDVIRMVEIGVKKGNSGVAFLGAIKELHWCGIDPWQDRDPEHPAHAQFGDKPLGQKRINEWFTEAKRVLEPFGTRAETLAMKSVDAVNGFEDELLDVVFIDGDHFDCATDIRLWWPKLRVGGLMIGHDYSHQRALPHNQRWDVKLAAENFARLFGVPLKIEVGCFRFDKESDSPKIIDRYLAGPLTGEMVQIPDPPDARYWQRRPEGLIPRRSRRAKV